MREFPKGRQFILRRDLQKVRAEHAAFAVVTGRIEIPASIAFTAILSGDPAEGRVLPVISEGKRWRRLASWCAWATSRGLSKRNAYRSATAEAEHSWVDLGL